MAKPRKITWLDVGRAVEEWISSFPASDPGWHRSMRHDENPLTLGNCAARFEEALRGHPKANVRDPMKAMG